MKFCVDEERISAYLVFILAFYSAFCLIDAKMWRGHKGSPVLT